MFENQDKKHDREREEEQRRQRETHDLLIEMQRDQHRWRRWDIRFRLFRFVVVTLVVLLGYFLLRNVSEQVDGYPPAWKGQSAATLHSGMALGPHLGMVRVEGILQDGGEADAKTINMGLRNAFGSDDMEAVVLSINSPGGSPVQAGYIYEEINRLREQSPDVELYAVIRDVGASGAYYVAAAADQIFADQASLVGSIGVVSAGFGFVEAIKKLGVERRLYTAGSNKAALDPFLPEDPQQAGNWRESLEEVHLQFIERVRQGRGGRIKKKNENELFSGRVWTGEKAMELGLVDELHSVDSLARMLDLEEIVDYTVQPTLLEIVFSQLGTSLSTALQRLLFLERF